MKYFSSWILGYKPREVQFAIVEQNPTLLNITLFPENNNANRLALTFKNGLNGIEDLDGLGSDGSELEDKLDDLLGEYDELKEDEEEEEYDDTIFGIIPNPLAKVHRDITKTVDSFFENIPLIG